jgi:dihydrofolate reductase
MTSPRKLSMILALGANGALGRAGGLPWSYPEDRAHFERTTLGHAVVMGRRTWAEAGQPLAGRMNIVVSTRLVPPAGLPADGPGSLRVAASVDAALEAAWSVDPEPFVIGGAAVFDAALPRVTRIHLTRIPDAPEADVFYDLDTSGFNVVAERIGERGARFLVLERAVTPGRPGGARSS